MIMKKYIIIAAAALVAATACSKVETTIETPDEAISFKVVDYSTATKAGETSLITEGYNQFTTYAWVHADGATAGEPFMTNVTVIPDDTTEPTQWAPTGRPYFWPKAEKTYINFFSFAGSPLPAPANVAENSVSYPNVTIKVSDNILVADAAYGYKKNNKKANGDRGYYLDKVSEGVPTLFRHMLSQIAFDVKLDASAVTDDKYTFTATINELKVSCINQGSLSLTFAAPTTTPGESKFTDGAKWVAGTSIGTVPNTVSGLVLETTGTKTFPAAATEYKELMKWSTVMPQVLSVTDAATSTTEYPVTVSFKYTLKTNYTDEEHPENNTEFTETIEVKDVPLAKFTPSITEWQMNYRYTYHITINAVSGDRILFDPAVEKWDEAPAASYTYPEATTTTPSTTPTEP